MKFTWLILCATSVMAADVFEQTYDFSPGATLTVKLKPGGNLTILGEARDNVQVRYPMNERNRDFILEEIREGNNLTLMGDLEERRRRFSLDMTIKVPNKLNLKFYTSGGNIVMKNMDGSFNGKTMGGNMVLSELIGDIDTKTMGGNIDVKNSELEGDIETMGGNIEIENSIGMLDCKTMGGNIEFENDGTYETFKSGEQMRLSTMGGNIELREAPGGVKASTMGGNIEVGRSWGYVEVDTKGGNITVNQLDGGISAKTYGGNIDVTVINSAGDDNRDIELVSKGGDVNLMLPKDFSGQFDVQLEVTRRSEGDYEIISDFLDVTVSGGADKMYKGAGVISGGKHNVKIRTVNGDIRIQKIQ